MVVLFLNEAGVSTKSCETMDNVQKDETVSILCKAQKKKIGQLPIYLN